MCILLWAVAIERKKRTMYSVNIHMYNSSGLRGAVQKVTFLAEMTAMGSHKKVIYLVAGPLREDTHKKKFFF